jgi:hypothetical protein
VTFRFVAGLQRCHVRQVKLLHKGRVIAEDAHEGRTGNEHVDNVWSLEFPDLTLADGLELEAEIRSEGALIQAVSSSPNGNRDLHSPQAGPASARGDAGGSHISGTYPILNP